MADDDDDKTPWEKKEEGEDPKKFAEHILKMGKEIMQAGRPEPMSIEHKRAHRALQDITWKGNASVRIAQSLIESKLPHSEVAQTAVGIVEVIYAHYQEEIQRNDAILDSQCNGVQPNLQEEIVESDGINEE